MEAAFRAARGATRARASLTFIGIFLVFASIVAVLWSGAQEVLAGNMTPGTLGQFVLFAVFAASSLGQLSEVWGEVAQAAGAAERITELLAITPRIREPERPVALPKPALGVVAFDNVRFAYPTRTEAPVLDGVSFTVRPGERVALVGPSGAGKSTVFHLLLRAYDPLSGSVKLDGVPLTDADPEDVRRHIALVPQDVDIFAATVAENIRIGRPDASDAEVQRAADLRRRRRVRRQAAAGLRDADRRARHHAVGRPAPAHRHRPRHPQGRAACCCSTRPPPRSTPRARHWCRPRWGA